MRNTGERVEAMPGVECAASEVSAHELLNDATMWLQYARGVTGTLADLVHEAEEIDCKQLSLSLEAVAAMTRLGVRQLGEARARVHWDAASRL
jgi:hypothetical protein